jgi:hypothetical protein
MAEVNRISSFKSFSEIKSQENETKLREENNLKKQETLSKIEEILDEMGLTNLSEIDEDSQTAFISKLLGKETNEGNAFVYAAGKAKADGKKEFEFNGKTYKVTIKDTGIKEDNEIIDEAISRSIYDRMDGLHNIKAMKSLIDSAKTIFDDLSEEMFEFDEICDFIVMKIKKSKLAGMYESVNEARIKAPTALQEIIDGNTSRAEGIKLSKPMAEHILNWINTSAYGKKYGKDLPLNIVIKASFSWGVERGLDPKLKSELDTLKDSIKESVINEAKVKQFDADFNDMVKNIKSGYGWIDPEYVADTWENSSDSVDFELVKGEIYKRLIAAGLLAYPNPDDEEKKGVPVRKLQELGIKESITNEATVEVDATDPKDKNLAKLLKKHKVSLEVINKNGPSGWPEVKLTGDIKDLKAVLADSEYGWDDEGLADYIEESIVNESGMGEIDQMAQDAKDFKSFVKEFTKKYHDLSNAGEPGQFKEWLQSVYDAAKENMDESVVTEGNDDYTAKFGSADINLKKGYKHLVEYDLEDLYNKLGVLSKEYKIKGITATFEAIVTEAEVSSDDEFKEYAMAVLKKAFGEDFDEAKAGEVVDGILKKCGDDYGACIGMLTSSLGESNTNEAFDAKYWEDYHEKSKKITSDSKVARAVEDSVENWNDNNEDGKDNEVTPNGEAKVMDLAHAFFKAKGWISFDIIDAMIAQES